MREFDPESAFGYIVNRVAALVREQLEARTRPFGLTAPQAAILMGCYAGVASTPAQFRRVHWVDPAAITRLLDQLERKGHIRRTPNPNDRRSVLIELTESGAEIAPKVTRAAYEMNERLAGLLSSEDFSVTMESLRRILHYSGAGLRPGGMAGGAEDA